MVELISVAGMCGCTLAFHNGFSPVFSVFKESRKGRVAKLGVVAFFVAKLIFDAVTGVLPATILQYPCYYCAWVIAEKTAVGSATLFYLMSNSVCWLQMSGVIGGFPPIYSNDVFGYVTCMTAGLPYYVNSIAATVLFSLAFSFIRDLANIRLNLIKQGAF